MPDREYITRCLITCPDCGGEKHIKDWYPGLCPRCGSDLRGYTSDDLRAVAVEYTVIFSQLTGQAVILRDDQVQWVNGQMERIGLADGRVIA